MRDILFRGKRVDNGEWVYGFYWFVEEHKNSILSKRHFIKSLNNGNNYEIIPETVGQFTGLTDNNGTKIFEGDIVKCVEHRSNYWVNTSTRQRGSNAWENNITDVVEFTPSGLQLLDGYRRLCSNLEVIGNIHEREQDE